MLQGLTQGQLEKPVLRKINFGGYCQLALPTGCILEELSRCELLADFRRHLLHHGLDTCECLMGSRLTLTTPVHHHKSPPIVECVQRERNQGDNLLLRLEFMDERGYFFKLRGFCSCLATVDSIVNDQAVKIRWFKVTQIFDGILSIPTQQVVRIIKALELSAGLR